MKKIIFYSIALFGLLLTSCSSDDNTNNAVGKWKQPVSGSKGTTQTITWEAADPDLCPISSFEILKNKSVVSTSVYVDTNNNCPTTAPADASIEGTWSKADGNITFTIMGQVIVFKIITSTDDELVLQAYNQTTNALEDTYYLFTK